MKTLVALLAATTAMTAPGLALAKHVTLTTTLVNYGGPNAYLAYYVTDSSGAYVGTLWAAGSRTRYFEHLSGWYRASGGNFGDINGITGASVGSGQTLTLTFDLVDSVFDAGYKLHIDTAAENMRAIPNDVVVPLTTDGAGKGVQGRGFIASFSYSM